MSDSKATTTCVVPLYFGGLTQQQTAEIRCSFPVKRIRFLGIGWATTDGTIRSMYLASTAPGLNFVCMVSSSSDVTAGSQGTSTNPYEIVLPSPISITGTYQFQWRDHDGTDATFGQDSYFTLALQFFQD